MKGTMFCNLSPREVEEFRNADNAEKLDRARRAAVRDSGVPCRACGAS